MSKKKTKSSAENVKAVPVKEPGFRVESPRAFHIPYPAWILLAVVLVLYFPSFHFGFTELDDSIFIKDLHEYNEDLSNLITSFHRGVFNPTNDTYYRPLFLDSIILNYRFSEMDVTGYHIVNILLHALSAILLFRLFMKLGLKELHCFLLALLFAAHPVISQAVVWIPGRNDTMLAVFTFSFFICSINYSVGGKLKWLALSVLLLLCAFFTKETAVFDAPAAFVLLVVFLKQRWNDRRNLVHYGAWVSCFVVWYAVRATATLKTSIINPAQLGHDFVKRSLWWFSILAKYFFHSTSAFFLCNKIPFTIGVLRL